MGRSGRDVALGLVTAVVLALLVYLTRDLALPLVDRALARITLLRVLVALAVLGLVHALVSTWTTRGDRLPSPALSSRAASMALGGIVGVVGGGWWALDRRVTLPTVFSDEYIYMTLAKSLARGDGPVVRGADTLGYGIAYPVLLAPVYALAGDGAQAFAGVQALNALVMASAAVPAYLLGRLVLERADALLVAALTVLTPLLAYTGYVLTESLFYPASLWTAYAVTRAVAAPSTRAQLVALAALAGVCSVRPQAIVLLPGAATAIAIVLLTGRRPRDELGRFRILLAGLGAAALLGLVVRAVSDTSPFGAYDVLVSWPNPGELLLWAGRELTGVGLATGILSLVVLPMTAVSLLARSATDAERALGATLVSFATWLLASVVVLDASPYGLGWTHLRNLIGVIPLVVLAGIVWVRRGMPRLPAAALAGAAIVLLGALATRSADLVHFGRHDSPSFLPWRLLSSEALPVERLVVLTVAAAVIVALTTRAQWALPVSVVAACLAIAPEITPRDAPWGVERARADRLAALDREVTPEGHAVVITAGLPDERCETHHLALTALWTEVLNISAEGRRLYGTDLIGPMPLLTIAPDGTVLDRGRPLVADAVAIDERVPIDGTPFATVALRELGGEFAEDPGGLRFWRTPGRVRVTDPDVVARLARRAGCPVA